MKSNMLDLVGRIEVGQTRARTLGNYWCYSYCASECGQHDISDTYHTAPRKTDKNTPG